MLNALLLPLMDQPVNPFSYKNPCARNTGLFKMIVGVLTTCHLVLQMQPRVISFLGVTSRIGFMFLLFPQVSQKFMLAAVLSSYNQSRRYRVIWNDCRGFNNLPPRSPDATPCDFFLWGYVKDQVYVPRLPASVTEFKVRIRTTIETITWHATNSFEWTRLSCWCL